MTRPPAPEPAPALSSLRSLAAALRTLPEAEVQALLDQERRGRNRPVFLHRLYARFKSLREARERQDLFGGRGAEAACLLRMWGPSPFDARERQAIQDAEADPEALRALLLTWVLAHDSSHAVPPSGWLPGPQAHAFTRAKILLESWVPGQTDFKEPSMVQRMKENLR